MKRIFIKIGALFLLVAIGYACVFLPREFRDRKLSTEITELLKEWQLQNSTLVLKSKSTAYIHIHYKNDSVQPFYLDQESHTLVLSMLCYTFYEGFMEYDTVKFEMTFEGYDDVINIGYDQNKIEEIKSYYDKAPHFYDFVSYSFINLGYKQILRAERLIEFFSEDFNDFFKFKGSYWLLLYNYCKASLDPPNHIDSIFCFLWFASDAKDYVPVDNVDLFDEHMKYFLRPFGYDEGLLDENFIGILEHLNDLYLR